MTSPSSALRSAHPAIVFRREMESGSNAKALIGIGLSTAIVCALLGLYIGLYLTNQPPSASAATTPTGARLYLATVPAAALNDPHPTWVSYYAVSANSTNWKHATTYDLPAHTLVRITIYNFDSQTGLRNPFISQATGTVGGAFTLAINKQPARTMLTIPPPTASHVFAVPQWGLSVPLYGISATAKNPCANAPCALTYDHSTTTFTVRTPGPGLYRWQCFVPCAAGFIQGFGGPMQTVGYMDGFIKVA
jgi:hypothetical protein